MSEAPIVMSVGTGQISTWTGKDPALREPGETFDDNITHEPLAGKGGVSTWSGVDPADRPAEAEAPVEQPPLENPAGEGPPIDPPTE